MVICRYFQQGSCRFGSKCANEHFDVKQLLKTDAESALNGKQWPFSCFGPFKDKGCIPNFIEDQSFEEIRFLCYEARKNNTFEQFHQQLNKAAQDANMKIKALLQMSPEIVEMITDIYDAATNESTSAGNNPFGMSAGGLIFAKSAVTNSNNNMFVGNNTGGNLFANTANNNNANSIFGQQTNVTPSNPIFGGGSQNSVFALPQNMSSNAPTGLFAQAAQQQQQQQNTGGYGLFAQAAQQTPMNANAPQNNIQFSSQQQQTTTGLFAQAVQSSQLPTAPPAGSFFNNPAAPNQNLFAQQASQPVPQFPSNTGLFAQAIQQTAAPPTSGFFAQQQTMPTAVNMQMQQMPVQQNVVAAPPPAYSGTIYSKMENLSSDDIDAFKANTFVKGKIPFDPPPRELVQ